MINLICISLILLSFLLFHWKVSLEIIFDNDINELILRIFLFKVKAIEFKISLDFYNKALKIKLKNKVKFIELNNNQKNKDSISYFINNLDKSILEFIDIQSISFYSIIGYKNAFYSTIITQWLRITFISIISVLKSWQEFKYSSYIIPDYFEKNLKIKFLCILNISILELLCGVIKTISNKIKQLFRRNYDY